MLSTCLSGKKLQGNKLRDQGEDSVSGEQPSSAIKGALGHVRVRCRHCQPPALEEPSELAHANPVLQRSLVDGEIDQKIRDQGQIARSPGSADQLGNNDWWQDDPSSLERRLEAR